MYVLLGAFLYSKEFWQNSRKKFRLICTKVEKGKEDVYKKKSDKCSNIYYKI